MERAKEIAPHHTSPLFSSSWGLVAFVIGFAAASLALLVPSLRVGQSIGQLGKGTHPQPEQTALSSPRSAGELNHKHDLDSLFSGLAAQLSLSRPTRQPYLHPAHKESEVCSFDVPPDAQEIAPHIYLQAPYGCAFGNLEMIFSLDGDTQSISTFDEAVFEKLFCLVLFKANPGLNFNTLTDSASNMQFIMLAEHAASGTIRSSLFTSPDLSAIDIRSLQQLVGTLPPSLLQASALRYFTLTNTGLTGSIPSGPSALTNLRKLDLSGNLLTGSIPLSLFNSPLVRYFAMSSNSIEGSLPSQLGLLTKLTDLRLDDNKLAGFLPSQLGLLTDLVIINVNKNKLTGPIPSQFGQLTNLQELSLANNQFTGALPSQLVLMTKLASIDVSHNLLHGTIPQLPQTIVFVCGFSGLDSMSCARDCSPCSLWQFEVQRCDSRGFHQQCIAGYLFLPLLLVFLLAVAFALKRISPRDTPRSQFAREALMSALAIADLATDVAFTLVIATDSSFGSSSNTTTLHSDQNNFRLRSSAIGVLVLFVIVSFCVSITVVSVALMEGGRKQARSRIDTVSERSTLGMPSLGPSYLERLISNTYEFRERVADSTFLASLIVTFCAFNIRMTPFVVQGGQAPDRTSRGSTEKWYPSLVSFVRRKGQWSRQAFARSPLPINSLQPEPHQGDVASPDIASTTPPMPPLADVPMLSLRTIVGVLTVVLEDIPFVILQVLVLVTGGTRRLVVVLALVFSVLSIVVECARLLWDLCLNNLTE